MKNIKKSIVMCVAALSMGTLAGCDFFNQKPAQPEQNENEKEQEQEQQVVHVESLEISPEELDVLVGEEKSITATIAPENATDKTVVFKSNKTSVATVSLNGTVKGVGAGTAIITVQSVENPSKFKTCTVTVTEAVVHVTDVVIGESTVTLTPGSSSQLSASVLPENATNKTLIWSSNNESVVTVDQQGHIQAGALGQASITVQSQDNPTKFKTFTVKVEETVIPVTGIALNLDVKVLEENDPAFQLEATVAPADASNKSIYWTSSTPAVATVGQDGTVTPVSAGNATIKATTIDGGFEAACAVTVTKTDVASFELDIHELSFASDATGENAKKQLTATISPATATYKEVEWSSSNEGVATVSSTGLVEMKGVGTAVITALHVNSRMTDSCVVTVVEPTDLVPTLPIRTNKAYQSYKSNIRENPANRLAEFADRTQVYEIGDDNKINLKPEFTLLDGDANVIDQNAWAYPFVITVEKKEGNSYVTAPAADYSVINATTCDLKFNASAVDNFYKIRIKLGGLTPEEETAAGDQIYAEYEVKIVDGYNVTSEIEMAYLDTSSPSDEEMGMGADHFTVDYPAFKAAHHLNAETPATLVLHKDMNLSMDYVPERLCVTAEDAATWDQTEKDRAIGSFKDDAYLYRKFSAGKTTLSGNYFTIDWSKIPLVKRTRGKPVGEVKTESHAGFLRTFNGSFEIKNVNIIGNSHTATTELDTVAAGGLIGFKTRNATTEFTASNVLGHGCYIVFMNEGRYSTLGGTQVCEMNLVKSKIYDNYNCFIYNWGGHVVADQCIFEGSGGPIVIQDHVHGDDKPYELAPCKLDGEGNPVVTQEDEIYKLDFSKYMHYNNGVISTTTFIDSELNNYVLGTEAWFGSFGAAALTGQIKALCDFIASVGGGLPRTAIFDTNHVGTTYQSLSTAGQDSLFNFVVLNKSGSKEGTTNCQVNGEVKFLHRNGENLEVVDDFNYMAPEFTQPGQFVDGNIEKYFNFRNLGENGAPVFETAGGSGFVYEEPKANPEEGTEYVFYDLDNIRLDYVGINHAKNSLYNKTAVNTAFNTGAHENVALYYNGMMLVMKLGYYGQAA